MSTIEERVAALEEGLAKLRDALGQIPEWVVLTEQRLTGLEAVNISRGYTMRSVPTTVEPAKPGDAPIPDWDLFVTHLGNESNPNGAGIAKLRAEQPRGVQLLGGLDRLGEIESELAALALRRGALVGERERLRG